MKRTCGNCKYWGPNEVGDTDPPHLIGDCPCHNQRIRKRHVRAAEVGLPEYIRPRIVSGFDVPYDFGCVLYREEGTDEKNP